MPIVVMCDWCKEITPNYISIQEHDEDHPYITPKYMCFACALVSRALRLA